MMLGKLLSLHDQRPAPLLADEDDRHDARRLIDVEKYAVLAEEPQLAIGHRV
jgi:hypothetical protein